MMNTRRRFKQTQAHGGRRMAVALIAGTLFSALFGASPLAAQNGGLSTAPGAQITNPPPFSGPPTMDFPRRTEKQKEALLKYNYKQMKKHADQLAALAQSLQKKIGQTDPNVLSLEVVEKAEKIEKLAKKIKNEAKGY